MWWAGFVFGLLGSLHCVGMCGAIALALPGAGGSGWRFAGGRMLYQLGRLSTYAGLGAGVGLLGRGLQLAGIQQSLSIVSGGLILLLVVVPEYYTGQLAAALHLNQPLAWVKTSLGRLFGQPGPAALYAAGLLNGLLPCGLVYLALAGALSAPGAGGGAVYMLCFGLGTLPLMLALSLSGRLMSGGRRARLRRVVPYTASLVAGLFIIRGLGLGIPYLSPELPPATPTTPARHHTVHYCH